MHGAITPGKILIDDDNNKAFVSGVVSHELQCLLHPDTIPLRPGFMFEAPEVILADNPQKNRASDVFQFGMVIYRVRELERCFDPTMLISILSFQDLRWCSLKTPPFQSLTGSRTWSLWDEDAASRKRKDFHSHSTSNCTEPR